MIKEENFPNAYKETYVILNNMDEKDLSKIPHSFLTMIKEKMNDNYVFELSNNQEFEEKDIMQETKAILAYIFINYWATEEQKTRILNKFNQDIIFEQANKEKQYSYDNLFKNKKIAENIDNKETINDEELNNKLMVVKQENFLIKIFNKIKNIFKIK